MQTTKIKQKKAVYLKGFFLTGLLLMLAVPAQGIVAIAAGGDDADISILHRQSQILPTPWPVVRPKEGS